MDACQGRPGQLISVLLAIKRLLQYVQHLVWLAKIGIVPFQPSEASWKSTSALYILENPSPIGNGRKYVLYSVTPTPQIYPHKNPPLIPFGKRRISQRTHGGH